MNKSFFPDINIIFDFDGVVINSHKVKTSAFFHTFKSYGRDIASLAQQYHLENTGKSRYLKFNFILKNFIKIHPTNKIINSLDQIFDDFVNHKIKDMYPSDYFIKFLTNKNKSTNIYISTGTPQNKIVKILKQKKLIQYFKEIYGSPMKKVEHIKLIKSNKKKCIFIGDSFEDFKASKDANIPFILKINSENIKLRQRYDLAAINSFKFLEKKIKRIIDL